MNFGQALELVKQGNLVRRSGWNGKNMFVFMRPEDELTVEFIQTKVKSLPQSFKDSFIGNKGLEEKVKFLPYLCMFSAQGEVVNGWLASQTDMLSDDWEIVE